jgi:NhaP-type Na+/H+ or K+/H+ antiporter
VRAGTLRADPVLNSIVFGESVLNDAVSLIVFRSILHYSVLSNFVDNLHVHLSTIALSFCITAAGSILYGVCVGVTATIFFRVSGLGRSGQAPAVECALFWVLSYFSFVGAEVPHLSGIVASLFGGIVMRACADAGVNIKPQTRHGTRGLAFRGWI